jgi:uncharacterized protein
MTDGSPGEKNLDKLLATMNPTLDPETYVFCTYASSMSPIPPNVVPRMMFQESEGKTTLILTKDQAEAHAMEYAYPCRRITLHVHSSLDAIGFLAHITTHLASNQKLSVNAVSAFYHDHLFIPQDRADDAMEGLQQIIEAAKKGDDLQEE